MKKGAQLIEFAGEKGIKGVAEFCASRGYSGELSNDGKDELQAALAGEEYFAHDINLNGYDDDKFPDNETMMNFIEKNFYVYNIGDKKYAACLGEISMCICMVFLDGIFKSEEFQDSKDLLSFGGWYSMMFESCGNTDARDRSCVTFFDLLLKCLLEYDIVKSVSLPDGSDSIYIILNFEKYFMDGYVNDFPENMNKRINRNIKRWVKELKEWDEEFS